jgi:hypothetical protein
MSCGGDEFLCNPMYLQESLEIGKAKEPFFHSFSTQSVNIFGTV